MYQMRLARHRDTGALYVSVGAGKEQRTTEVTLYQLEVAALNAEAAGEMGLATYTRSFIESVRNCPLGAAPLFSSSVDGVSLEVGTADSLDQWLQQRKPDI